MFSITPIPSKHRVYVVFEGAFEHELDPFLDELKLAMGEVKKGDGSFDFMTDFTKAHVMPQEHAIASEQFIAWCLNNGLRKSANIMPTITQRMQVQRVSERDDRFSYFGTREEAERWLDLQEQETG